MRGIWPAIYAVVAGTAGLAVMAAAGAPRTALVIQTAALAVGGAIAGFLARGRRPIPNALVLPGLALGAVLIGLPLLVGPDVEGVRRWLQAGPLLIQPAMIVLPPMVWLYARDETVWVGKGVAVIAAGLLALQPDQAGGMALAMALMACVIVRRRRRGTTATADTMVFTAAMTFQFWGGMGGDPLPAVAHVELAAESVFAANAAFGVLAWLVLLTLPLPLLLYRRGDPANIIMACLWIGLIGAAIFKNYPEPIIGYSASLALGWMISLGLVARKPQEPT